MTGARLKVEVTGLDEAERRLRALQAAGHDLTPAMKDIGEYLLRTTRERFADEKGPDGTPWAPLSEHTKRRKKRNVERVLTEHGYLGGTLAYRAGPQEVEVGSPLVYAGTHQFGAEKGAFGSGGGSPIPWGDIPARPFLGLSDDDREEVVNILGDFLLDAL